MKRNRKSKDAKNGLNIQESFVLWHSHSFYMCINVSYVKDDKLKGDVSFYS